MRPPRLAAWLAVVAARALGARRPGGAAPRGGDGEARELLVVNALEAGGLVDIYYTGVGGRGLWGERDDGEVALVAETMLCVMAGLEAGFEFAMTVGQEGDEFLFARPDGAPCDRGRRYEAVAARASVARWTHARSAGATVFLVPEYDVGDETDEAAAEAPLAVWASWRGDLDSFAAMLWKEGVGSLFEDADAAEDEAGAARAFGRARAALRVASALGDTAAGTVAYAP